MEIWLVPNFVPATQIQVKEVLDATKALREPGLVFRTQIQPQYSTENVILIFLLVS